jgi:hypothetical protein
MLNIWIFFSSVRIDLMANASVWLAVRLQEIGIIIIIIPFIYFCA